MGYTDAQGRPELTVNPRIKLGLAGYRTVSVTPDSDEETPAGGAVPAATDAGDSALPAPKTARRRPVRR